jgi:hypothetical protein
MEVKYVFMFFATFSILLFSLVLLKRTFVAQLLGPAIPEPFGEKMADMDMWLQPY